MKQAMLPFYLYMLRCSDGTYDVGHTDDIDRRMEQHETGVVGTPWCEADDESSGIRRP